jgi:hypothetical protein
MLPFYLAFAAVLYPPSAAGQSRAFAVESEVAIHADSFACKETSERSESNKTGIYPCAWTRTDMLSQ